jgi:manganese/zinc/iron transport system ATP- binding protein
MTAPPALELRRLTVSYGARPVVWDVDASFPAGALSAIVGPNGAGKSTLLRAALGLVPSDGGQALIEGRPARAALKRVAYVPQRDTVDWDFPITVREVVEMGRYPRLGWLRRLGSDDRRVVHDSLGRVGMAPFAGEQLGELSGGQRQRVFIARALAQEAPIMLLDEPFAGVDARTEAELLDVFRGLRGEGRTVVAVHHDIAAVRRAFDRALLMNVRAIACGPVREVLVPERLRLAYAGAAPGAADGDDDLAVLEWAR